ncbi:hypothetical protein ACRCUN_31115 [Mycobacterium sp. LTG2003]
MTGLVNPGENARSTAPKASTEHVADLKRVVRATLDIPLDTTVLVQQLACKEPGCPPVETVVAVLSGHRATWKIPEPTADLTAAELRRIITEHPEGHDHADHN